MSLVRQEKRLPLRRPLVALNDKGRAILAAMVYGLDGKMAEKHGVEPSKGLGVNQVADLFRVRRRYVRSLLLDPVFSAELARAVNAKQQAHTPEALDRTITLMRSEDERVALKACQDILSRSKQGLNVNVGVAANPQPEIRAGYVIRIGPDRKPAPSIEGVTTP
jgi:hypothetical protein